MRATVDIAFDILREALARRWFLAFAVMLSAVHLCVALGLRLEVVDGALAASRLFNSSIGHDIRPVDVVLATVFEAATYMAFYTGLGFGVIACSDFGPELLAPGRIEHLLSLPIRRVELLLGTFLGVMLLCLAGTTYGAGGFFLILCAKAGVWTWRPLFGMYLASIAFFALYACMLCAAMFVRSAAASAAAGGAAFLAGIVVAKRDELGALFEAGLGRAAFMVVTAPLPRVAELADAAASIAVGKTPAEGLERLLLGTLAFGAAVLCLGAWRLEGKDF